MTTRRRQRSRWPGLAALPVLALAPCALLSAGEERHALSLDPGGFTVDMQKLSGAAVTGPDLLRNGSFEEVDGDRLPVGWTSGLWIWLSSGDSAVEARLAARVRPMMRSAIDDAAACDGRRAAMLSLADPGRAPGDPSGVIDYYPHWEQYVEVEEPSKAGSYVLSFRYRGERDLAAIRSEAFVRVTPHPKGKYGQVIVRQADEWRSGELSFSVPAGTTRIQVRVLLRYCGRVWFDKVALHRAADADLEAGLSARVMPWFFLRDRYCLSEADPGTLVFGFSANDRERIAKPHLVLQLPTGVEILDMARTARLVESRSVAPDDRAVQEHRIDISAWKRRAPRSGGRWPFAMWRGLSLLLKTSLPAGGKRYSARYWVEDETYRTPPRSFEVQIVPPVKGAPAPCRFRSGAFLFLVGEYAKPEGIDAFSSLYQACGFNMVHVAHSPLNDEFGRLGIERYAQPFVNGYSVGAKKPENAIFRDVNGKPVRNGVCPTEVYEQGDYFTTQVRDEIFRRVLVTDRSAEQIMANWEPHVFQGKGCFCERCKTEFQRYAKLTPEELDRIWPKRVIAEQGDLWTRFRSWQHGRVVVTLEETIHDLSEEAGRELHFSPAVHYRSLTDASTKSVGEYMTRDYLTRMHAWMPWAPYNWSIFGQGPYNYIRGRHLNCHTSACQVQAFLKKMLPEGHRPKLIAYPYGTYEGATQPEAIAFEVLSYFVNGYDGAMVYLFPGGYDARYWQTLADANRLIARFEDLVSAGQAESRHRVTPRTPLPDPDPGVLSPGERLPLILSWEFKKGGRRLIAVGNFWEESESFFDLSVNGLDSSKRHVLHEPAANRVYTDADGRRARSSAELERPTLLHVGAMRFAFFIVEPYREDGDYGAAVRPQEMAAALSARRAPSVERDGP